MKNLISFSFLLIFLISFDPAYAQKKMAEGAQSCESGECIPKLISQLEESSEIYREQCLPKGIKESDVASYHQKNGVSIPCFDMINRINRLEGELQKHKNILELKTNCETNKCKEKPGQVTAQISELTKIKSEPMCTPEIIVQVKNRCSADLQCVAFLAGPPISNLLFNLGRPPGCSSSVDNHCGVQLITSFFKAAVTFFKGSWELLKIAGGAIGNKMSDFWEKVAGPEDHSSTAQLALARASEEPGFFDKLTNDFSGTMKHIWELFVNTTKDWLKNDVFCQSWSGAPHFSKCLKPSPKFDCTPCNTLVTGLCSISGTLVAEVVPAFLTGGLFTAVKHGARGVGTAVKTLKISDAGLEAIRTSHIGRIASDTTSTATRAVGKAGASTLAIINSYLLNPARKILKASFHAIENLMKTGSPTLAVSPVGKVLSFTGTTLSSTLRIVLYPIDNQLTQAAYRLGGKSFDKLLSLGSPKLSGATAVTTAIIARNPQIEAILAKIEEAKISRAGDQEVLLKLEKELLEKVTPIRLEAARSALASPGVDLSEVIRRLYPELQFGALARSLPREKIIAAESELYLELAKVEITSHRSALLKKYEFIVGDGVNRKAVLGDTKLPYEIPRLERTAALDNYNIPLTVAQTETKNAIRAYMDKNFEQIVENSMRVEQKLRSSATPIVYDTVAVGAGPKNAILVSALKETNPGLNVLVIESTDSLGTFHRVKGFDINSAEWIGDSGNGFPTSSLHLRDFNINNSAYATAEELGHATQAAWQIADPDIIFKSSVSKISKEPSPGAWPAKYKIETDNGIAVYAKSTVVTPGLGAPVNRLKDAASLAVVTKHEEAAKGIDLIKDSRYIPKFQDVETYISNAFKDQKLGREAVGRYRKKTTLLVGDGDGGNIGAEAALGLNKQLNPSGKSTDIKLIWMGQAARSSEEFVKGLSRAKQPRYARIGEALNNGRISPVNGYLAKIEEFTNEAGETQFKAYYTTKKGDPISDPVIVDNVVFATGYTHSHKTVTPYFQTMAKEGNSKGDEIVFKPLYGKLNEFSRYDGLKTEGLSEINKQLYVNGQMEDIFLTGLGGKTPISKRKMKTVTGGFLDIAGVRAAATGEHIATKLTSQTLSQTPAAKLLQIAQGEKTEILKKIRIEEESIGPREVVNINNKLELARSLRNFKTSPNSEFFLSISKNEEGKILFTAIGLNKESGLNLIENIAANKRLSNGFASELGSMGNRIDIKISSRTNGSIQNESTQMRTVNLFKNDSYDPTSRWPSALMKITSPTLRTAGQEKEEDKK